MLKILHYRHSLLFYLNSLELFHYFKIFNQFSRRYYNTFINKNIIITIMLITFIIITNNSFINNNYSIIRVITIIIIEAFHYNTK